LGAILGIIGLIIVIAEKPGLPAAPHGMRAVKCPQFERHPTPKEKRRPEVICPNQAQPAPTPAASVNFRAEIGQNRVFLGGIQARFSCALAKSPFRA
jgi:hypothetical protein